MADASSNLFEIERRSILFKSSTTMPDLSTLGYNGNPNDAFYSNSDGEFLLYYSPVGTSYMEDSGIIWDKNQAPNIWEIRGSSSTPVISLSGYATVTSIESISGYLQGEIDALDFRIDTLTTTVVEISANLQNQIDSLDFLSNSGGNLSGPLTINGNLTVSGNIIQISGSNTTQIAETLIIEDNLIVLNSGELGAGVSTGVSGIEIDRGTETPYQFMFRESDDSFVIGISGDLQSVATREDSPIDQGVAYWNNTQSRFDTSTTTIDELVTSATVTSISSNLQYQLDNIDISETYDTLLPQANDYTFTGSVSTVIPVASYSNSFTVKLDNTNMVVDRRVRIQDVYEYCGTNAVYITDINDIQIGKVNTDDGAIEFAWTGFTWQLIDKFENIWDRNELINEITTREGETLVANAMRSGDGTVKVVTSNTGVDVLVNDVSVASFDENGKLTSISGEIGVLGTTYNATVSGGSNIGTNVDQNGTSDFGNGIAVLANPFNQGNYQTSDSTPYITSCFPASTINPPYIAFDGILNLGTTRVSIPHGGGECWIRIDTGTPRMLGATKVNFKYGDKQFSTEWRIQGSNDNSNWDTLYFSNGSVNNNLKVTFDNIGSYRYYRWQSDSGFYDGYISIVEIYLYGADYATTSNTTDLAISTGAKTYALSSFKAYDENDVLIEGTGKINVAYNLDGLGFSTLVDQVSFQELANVTSSTSLKLQIQAVGSQRWSRVELSTVSTTISMDSTGFDFVVNSTSVYNIDTEGNVTTKAFNATTSMSISGVSVATVDDLLPYALLTEVSSISSNLQNQIDSLDFLSISGGNLSGPLTINGNLTVTPSISANAFYGDGSNLTGIPTKYIDNTVGDNSTNPITITHNLGTKDVIVSVRDKNTDELVTADIIATSINSIVITFGVVPTTAQYSVKVIG